MKFLKDFYGSYRFTWPVAVLFPVLYLLSLAFALAVRFRRFLYARRVLFSYRPQARVISIGNITLGGSGKTPLVAYVAGVLSRGSRRVTVLLRGYKRPRAGWPAAGSDRFCALGDEGSMLVDILGDKVPVLAAADRARLAQRLDSQKTSDVFILDDGFQHLPLKRDLDIVTIDATRPFGNRCLLPAGPLREELAALARADIFCLTRCDEVEDARVGELEEILRGLNPLAMMVRSVHRFSGLWDPVGEREADVRSLRGESVAIVCGIAHPSSFQKSVETVGARVVLARFFDDHHVFSVAEWEAVRRAAEAAGAKALITTQKDHARLSALIAAGQGSLKVFIWKVSLDIVRGKEVFDARLALV